MKYNRVNAGQETIRKKVSRRREPHGFRVGQETFESFHIIINLSYRFDILHPEGGEEMNQAADEAMAFQEPAGILHSFRAAVFLIAPSHRCHPGLFLPIILPADALEKKKEIDGLQGLPIS